MYNVRSSDSRIRSTILWEHLCPKSKRSHTRWDQLQVLDTTHLRKFCLRSFSCVWVLPMFWCVTFSMHLFREHRSSATRKGHCVHKGRWGIWHKVRVAQTGIEITKLPKMGDDKVTKLSHIYLETSVICVCSFSYPHPYQYELDHFVPVKNQLEKVTPQVGHFTASENKFTIQQPCILKFFFRNNISDATCTGRYTSWDGNHGGRVVRPSQRLENTKRILSWSGGMTLNLNGLSKHTVNVGCKILSGKV